MLPDPNQLAQFALRKNGEPPLRSKMTADSP